MYPVFFKLGFVTIYTYGIFVFIGVLLGYLVCKKIAKEDRLEDKLFSGIFFWTIIFGFLGAKVLYILIEFKYFLVNPFGMLRSGFVFYGGVIAGLFTVFALAKKHKIYLPKLLDIFAVALPLGHAFGRLGCFSYGCCYGRATDSSLGILFPPTSAAGFLGVKVIPTQLIASFFLFLIFFTLFFARKHKKFSGQIFICYIFLYGIFRFSIEFFRADPRGEIFSLSTSQFMAIILMIIGIFLFFRYRRQA